MKLLSKVILIILFLAVNCTLCSADIPHLINYQGRLTDKDNQPLDGTYTITFRLYDSPSGGNLLWSETHSNISISKGLLNIILGSVTPLNLAFDRPYYLSIQVEGDLEMTPRQLLTSAGYAIRAESAEVADSLPPGVILMCKGSCPPGYKRISALDGRFLVGGGTYNPAAGGSNTHTHSVPYTGWPFSGGSAPPGTGTLQTTAQSNWDEHATGNHVTGEADSRPEFATVILCERE